MRVKPGGNLFSEVFIRRKACVLVGQHNAVVAESDLLRTDDFNRRVELGILRHGDRFTHGDCIAVATSAQRLCQGIALVNGLAVCIGYKNLLQLNRLFGQRIDNLAALVHNGNRMGIKTAEHLVAKLCIRLNHGVCIGQNKAIGAKRNLLCADKRDLCGNFRVFRHGNRFAHGDCIAVPASAQRFSQRIAFIQHHTGAVGNNNLLFRLRNFFEGVYKGILCRGLFHRVGVKPAQNHSFNVAVRGDLRLYGCKNQPVAVPGDTLRADHGNLCRNGRILIEIHRGIDRDHIAVRTVFQRFVQAVSVVQNRSACIGNGDKFFVGKEPQGRIQRNALDRGICVISAVFPGCKRAERAAGTVDFKAVHHAAANAQQLIINLSQGSNLRGINAKRCEHGIDVCAPRGLHRADKLTYRYLFKRRLQQQRRSGFRIAAHSLAKLCLLRILCTVCNHNRHKRRIVAVAAEIDFASTGSIVLHADLLIRIGDIVDFDIRARDIHGAAELTCQGDQFALLFFGGALVDSDIEAEALFLLGGNNVRRDPVFLFFAREIRRDAPCILFDGIAEDHSIVFDGIRNSVEIAEIRNQLIDQGAEPFGIHAFHRIGDKILQRSAIRAADIAQQILNVHAVQHMIIDGKLRAGIHFRKNINTEIRQEHLELRNIRSLLLQKIGRKRHGHIAVFFLIQGVQTINDIAVFVLVVALFELLGHIRGKAPARERKSAAERSLQGSALICANAAVQNGYAVGARAVGFEVAL